MSVETIARRYSTALADAVIAGGDAANVKNELEGWARLFADSDDLRAVFGNPSINHDSKVKVLDGLIAKTKPSKTTANFLKVLLQNGRLTEIVEINDRFGQVLEERSGVVSAEIISAREVSESEKGEFERNLTKLTGKQVKVNYKIDQDLIGGAVTRIGSTVYDGSVKTKLETLREQLVNG